MALALFLTNNDELPVKNIDIISEKEVTNFIIENNQLIKYIDPYDDCYFNRKQVKQILKEIDAIKDSSTYNQNYVIKIEKAAHTFMMQNSYHFLSISGE